MKNKGLNIKLLSLLLDEKVLAFEVNKPTNSGDNVLVEFEHNQKIYNLSELASKCKETFIHYGNDGRGYCIMSFLDFDGTWFANVSGCIYKQSFQGESEHEVVFKSSNWIMEIEDKDKQIEKDAIYEEYYD